MTEAALLPTLTLLLSGSKFLTTLALTFTQMILLLHFRFLEDKDSHFTLVFLFQTLVFSNLILSSILLKVFTDKNQQKQQNEIEAADSEVSRNNFFAALTHEIRNPLNSLLGTIEILEAANLNKSQIEFLKNAKDSGEILTMMVNNLLDVSKVEAGKFELVPEIVEYRQQIWKIIQTLKANAIKKGIELSIENDPKIPRFLYLDIARFS